MELSLERRERDPSSYNGHIMVNKYIREEKENQKWSQVHLAYVPHLAT